MGHELLLEIQKRQMIQSLYVILLEWDDFLHILDGWVYVMELFVKLASVEYQVDEVFVDLDALVGVLYGFLEVLQVFGADDGE